MSVEQYVDEPMSTAASSWRISLDGRGGNRGSDREVIMASSPYPRVGWRSVNAEGILGGRVLIEGFGYRWERQFQGAVTFCDVDSPLPPHSDLRCTVELDFADHRETVSIRFGTAGFHAGDWIASWQSVPSGTGMTLPAPRDPVEYARVTIAARGVVRVLVDGQLVNADRIDLSRTDLARALYRAFDITDLLTSSSIITVVAGRGGWVGADSDPEVFCEVLLQQDGTARRVAFDEYALRFRTEVVVDMPFYLEEHDAAAAGPIDIVPRPATSPAVVNLAADVAPPIRTTETFTCSRLGPSAGGPRVYDVGTNIAGRARLRLRSAVPSGTVVEVQHGEILAEDGRVDTTNITMPFDNGRPRQVLRHTIRTGDAIIEPWFSYYGFRYIEVRGLPADAEIDVEALAIHTDLSTSTFVETTSDDIARLLERGRRTMLNNIHSIPEDCPTREQSGWTGDIASAAEWILGAFDSEAFLVKWFGDLETSQRGDGGLPAISPDVRAFRMPSDPVWGSALPRLLAGHWLHYGDRRVVERHLPTLQRWAHFLLACRDERGIITRAPTSYGHDWLGLVQTPPPLLHTLATIECFETLAWLSATAGDDDCAQRWSDEADQLRSSARDVFWDPRARRLTYETQGAIAIAIRANIVPTADVTAQLDRLVSDIRWRGNRVSGGFATIRAIVRVLQEHGRSDVILDLLRQRDQPGIGAMLHHGPGTFWETWTIDPRNTGTGSLDHVGLGGPFAAWVHTGLFGLEPTAPGWAQFHVAPALLPGLGPLHLRKETASGAIEVSVEEEVSDVFLVRIVVPAATSATLNLPNRETIYLAAGTHIVPNVERSQVAHRDDALARRVGLLQLDDMPLNARPEPGDGAMSVAYVGTIDCVPIPHEQLHDGVHLVTGDGSGQVEAAFRFDDPQDLSRALAVHAYIDRCWLDVEDEQEMTIRVRSATGSEATASGRYWPSGWNRIAVDLQDWDGRDAVISIDVGLRPTGAIADNAITAAHVTASSQVSFHLSGVWYDADPGSDTRHTQGGIDA